jgi:hypothetical protein
MQDIEANKNEVAKEPPSFAVAGRAAVITKDVANCFQGVALVVVAYIGLEVL